MMFVYYSIYEDNELYCAVYEKRSNPALNFCRKEFGQVFFAEHTFPTYLEIIDSGAQSFRSKRKGTHNYSIEQ